MAITNKRTGRDFWGKSGRWLFPVVGLLYILLLYQFYPSYIILPDNYTFPAMAADGWYPPANEQEKQERWTDGDATLRFANLGYPVGDNSFELNLNVGRGYDSTKGDAIAPVTVTVSIGGQVLGYINTGEPFKRDTISIPAAVLRDNGPDPVLRIASDTFTPASDTRKLGVYLGSGNLHSTSFFSPTILPPLILLLGLLLFFLYGLTMSRRIPVWGRILLTLLPNAAVIFGIGIMRVWFVWLLVIAIVVLAALLLLIKRNDVTLPAEGSENATA